MKEVYYLQNRKMSQIIEQWDNSGHIVFKTTKTIWERRSDLMGSEVKVGVIDNPPKLTLEVKKKTQ